jgi:hypothetical protein
MSILHCQLPDRKPFCRTSAYWIPISLSIVSARTVRLPICADPAERMSLLRDLLDITERDQASSAGREQADALHVPVRICRWHGLHSPSRMRDYYIFAVPWGAGGGAMLTNSGGRYPRVESGLCVLLWISHGLMAALASWWL